MTDLATVQMLAFVLAVTGLFLQLPVRHKSSAQLIFALFCGSIAMFLLKRINVPQLGAYHYLLGSAACFTCNAYWLFARSLFRPSGAFAPPVLLMAAAIALFIIWQQGYLFLADRYQMPFWAQAMQQLAEALGNLLSSCVLVLTFWEGCRGYSQAPRAQQIQRLYFLLTFGVAITSNIAAQTLLSDATSSLAKLPATIQAWVIMWVLLNSQLLLQWHRKTTRAAPYHPIDDTSQTVQPQKSERCDTTVKAAVQTVSQDDIPYLNALHQLLYQQQWYLKNKLKVGDLARALDLPEYRISRLLQAHFATPSFSQLINQLRIDHAKHLLGNPDHAHWPILVIGLESGFASIGPFSRAFKLQTGETPHQYRQRQLNQLQAVQQQ